MAPDQPTLQHLALSLADRGRAPALLWFRGDTAEAWTYHDLGRRIQAVAFALLDRGIEPGEPVPVIGRNTPAWIVAYFAIVATGGVAALVDNLYPASDIDRLLGGLAARRAFVSPDRVDEINTHPNLARLDLIPLNKTMPGWQGKANADPPTVRADDIASLLFTPGATGAAKTVPLTHRNILSNVEGLTATSLIGPGDRMALPLPLHHIYPFTVGLVSALQSGATLILPAGAGGPALVEAIRGGRATTLIAVPRLLEALVEAIGNRMRLRGALKWRLFRGLLALSRRVRRATGLYVGGMLFRQVRETFGPDLRLISSGGARLEPATARTVEALGWRVMTGYGLTETAPVVAFNRPGAQRIGSVGRPIPGVEIRIAYKEGKVGEILVRGPNVFPGYRDDAQATAAAFTPDGWFCTGDLGFVDRDGFLYIVGRLEELIVSPAGRMVFPEAIEKAIDACPLVDEVAVTQEDGRLVALIVPDLDALRERGAARARALIREEVEQIMTARPRHERLSDLRLVRAKLPRTRLGKLQRYLLPALWNQADGLEEGGEARVLKPEDGKLLARPRARMLMQWLENRFPARRLDPDTSFQLDLGFDSISWIPFTLDLEHAFEISLDDEAVGRIVTVRDLLAEALEAPPATGSKPALTQEDQKYLAPPGPVMRGLFLMIFALTWALMKGIFRVRSIDARHIPATGPVLLAPNHTSFLDAPAVIVALPWGIAWRACWAGWAGIMTATPIRRLLSRAMRVFPVDPDRRPAASLAAGLDVLKRGLPLVWFPEGGRAPTLDLLPFRPGIGLLLEEMDVPVVPVHIEGTFAAWPRHRRFPRPHPISITFGEPVTARQLAANGTGKTRAERIAEGLRQRHVIRRGRDPGTRPA